MRLKYVLAFLTIFFVFETEAKRFTNAYISFELPQNWDCKLEGTEWVCNSLYSEKAKEAIIILTAKESGPADTLEAYKNHLSSPRMLPTKMGPPVQSKPMKVGTTNINNHPWVDALHYGSEVTSYYTRYLATVKERIAILVTFSAHKLHYTKYSADFLGAINSLRIIAPKDLLSNSGGHGGGNETIGAPIETSMPADITAMDAPPEPSSGLKSKLMGLLLVVVAIAYYLYKKAQKKPKK